MSRYLIVAMLLVSGAAGADESPNPLINYAAFEDNVRLVGEIRKDRLVSEARFKRMAADRDTVVLDARSAAMFALLHIKGAKNLSFPDITAEELAKVIPSKSTRILIYCNNNFVNAPGAFPSKAVAASLNVHTSNALYSYGYTNVYELGPLIDIRDSKLEFAGDAGPRT
jgi:3-mercaptopyruvate sulfurtransferase SseA